MILQRIYKRSYFAFNDSTCDMRGGTAREQNSTHTHTHTHTHTLTHTHTHSHTHTHTHTHTEFFIWNELFLHTKDAVT